jgi:hypothetical protein
LTGVAQLLNAAGNDAYSRDPVLSWDDVGQEWLSRTGDTYHRFNANFSYLGNFQGPYVDAKWGISLVMYKGRMISYEDNVSPPRLVVYSRDGVLLERLELPGGPDYSLGLSFANGLLWLSNHDPINGSSFKAYDVLQ